MTAKRWPAFVAWDGLLPLVMATALDVVRLFLGRDVAEIMAILFVPMIGALLRCAVGVRQMRDHGVYIGWVRPCFLSAAIVVLMLFDGAANLLRCNGVPIGALAPMAAALYVIYLLMFWLAFRDGAASTNPFGE